MEVEAEEDDAEEVREEVNDDVGEDNEVGDEDESGVEGKWYGSHQLFLESHCLHTSLSVEGSARSSATLSRELK